MDSSKVNNLNLLGTIQNADESGIIVYATQVYDSQSGGSVENRITEVANNASAAKTAATNAQTAANGKGAQIVLSGNTLELQDSSGKTLGKTVDLSSYAVADQFVDTVTLVNTTETDVTDVEAPYIKITFKQSDKTPIRIALKDIWNVTNAADLKLSSDYKEATENSDVVGGDTIEQAIGKAEKKADDAAAAIPTKVSALTNDSGYQTAAQVKATKVNNAANADTATNLVSASVLAAGTQEPNSIVVKVGDVFSNEFTVPYATSAGNATKAEAAETAASATKADSATKATQDGSGNVITATYLTAEEITTASYDEDEIDTALGL